MIRSILLDLDGTLVNTEAPFARCFTTVLNNMYGCNATTLDYKKYELDQDEQLIIHFKEMGMIDPRIDKNDIMKIVYRDYTEYFIKAIQEDEALDNFELLRKLKEQKYILSLVTTCSRQYLDILNEHQGIYHLFSAVVAREDAKGELKPKPKAYNMALAMSGVKSNEGLAIEDTKKGVDAALRAGLKTIKVDNFTEKKYDDPRVIQEPSANYVLRKILEEKKYIS